MLLLRSLIYMLASSASYRLTSIPKRMKGTVLAVSILDKTYERSLLQDGYKWVIGCDEAGRGPLAGPIVVASLACIQDSVLISTATDSKKLSEKQRKTIYDQILSQPEFFHYSISIISPEQVDRLNILQATLLGMRESIEELSLKLGQDGDKCYAIVDGNKTPPKLNIPARPLVRGDSLCYSIALASNIAKVTRDEIMKTYDVQYPQYGFAKHKGYPTKEHILMIHEHGPCPIHRMSFQPLKGRSSSVELR